MRGIGYWISQYLLAAVTLFAILVAVDLAGGKNLADGIWMTLIWALVAAALFIAARYSRSGKR